jgi:hypothetical protein
MAEAGAGKSRWLGRVLAWQLLLHRIPTIVIDPTGGVVDNFLDKLIRLPREYQEQLWPRVIYVDMSGKGAYTVPFPLYYRLADRDSLYDIAQRYIEVVERLDPYLKTASVQGLNAIIALGTYSGMLLAALGYQITEAQDLIRRPEAWDGRLERALSISPEVKPAVEFLRSFGDLKPDARSRRSESFLSKIQPFIAEPTMAAMFGAAEPGVSWQQVVDGGQIVLLDFRDELNATRRRFKLLWCFRTLVDFFKLRGVAGRNHPVGLVIDEVTQLLGFGAVEHSVMAEDIEELTSVVARNYGVYLAIAHQNLPQLCSERIQKALMAMGIQMIGVQTDPESAQYLASYFVRYQPLKVKRYERVWMSDLAGAYVVDLRPIEFTPEEQTLLNSYTFMELGQFEFLVRAPKQEGNLQASLQPLSIGRLDQGLYPDQEMVIQARKLLMKRGWRPVRTVLAEISARQRGSVASQSSLIAEDQALPMLWGE